MPEAEITTIEKLRGALDRWESRYSIQPLVSEKFSKSLYNLTDFVATTLKSYSAYSQKTTSSVSQTNREVQKRSKGSVSIGTILPMIIADFFISRLYGLSYLGAWGLLEQYLKDVLWLVLTESIAQTKSRKSSINPVKRSSIDPRRLTTSLLESRKHNINEIIQLYKDLLGLDLNKNEDFKALIQGRKERNRLAHTGELLGYNSLIDEFREQKESVSKSPSEQPKWTNASLTNDFMKSEVIENVEGHKIIRMGITYHDPTKTTKSRELEKAFCSTVIRMWKLNDFLARKLFRISKRGY